MLALYTGTTFLSALLLFSVQPLFAKMVLPVLGGSPSVWAVAMCFFQAALLAGYCYAHLLARYMPVALGGALHLAVSAAAMLILPIGLRQAGASHRAAIRTRGSSACLRWRSACRSLPWRPMRRCCRRGSPEPGIRKAATPTSCMRRATSAACWHS